MIRCTSECEMCEFIVPPILSTDNFYDRQNEYNFISNCDHKIVSTNNSLSSSSCKQLDQSNRSECLSRYSIIRDADSTVVDYGIDLNCSENGNLDIYCNSNNANHVNNVNPFTINNNSKARMNSFSKYFYD